MRFTWKRTAGRLALALAATAAAQSVTPLADDTPPSETQLTPEQLQNLVAPIALYPDVLIAQILPAATFPTDVVMAARWLKTNPDMKDVTSKPWDVTVLSLCHYPEVLYKLDEDLEWTNALGAAFIAQPDDVMQAIQAARELAQERKLLQTTPQQTVVVEQETIRIVPTEAETVYVPQYDPTISYIHDDDDDDINYGYYDDDDADAWVGAAVGFGTGLALGAWLNMDCDWHGHCVHYCQPGYWGGWGHRGAVAWGDDWVAGVGPRGGFIAGEDRGVAVGRRGAAAWGPNGGAAWRRPPVATPLPAYTGRYASYNRSTAYSSLTNNVNVNRNANIDRGNRTNISGGNRTNIGGDRTNIGGDRTNIGGDRTNLGDRPGVGGDDRPRPGAGGLGGTDRPGVDRGNRPADGAKSPGVARPAERPAQQPVRSPGASAFRQDSGSRRSAGVGSGSSSSSAFNNRQSSTRSGSYGDRGRQSRSSTGSSSASPARRSPSTPSAQPSRSSGSSSRSGAFSSGGGRQSSSAGSRGASSRGGGSRGGSRGGGRGGGRR